MHPFMRFPNALPCQVIHPLSPKPLTPPHLPLLLRPQPLSHFLIHPPLHLPPHRLLLRRRSHNRTFTSSQPHETPEPPPLRFDIGVPPPPRDHGGRVGETRLCRGALVVEVRERVELGFCEEVVV